MQVFKNNVSLEATPTGDTHVTNKGYVDGAIEQEIASIQIDHGLVVDEKPTCTDNGDGTYTIAYKKNSVEKTTTDTSIFFYYKNEDGKWIQTKFVSGEEVTVETGSLIVETHIDETTGTWIVDSEDTGVQAKADTLKINTETGITEDVRIDIVGPDGKVKETTPNLKGRDAVYVPTNGFYNLRAIDGTLYLTCEDDATPPPLSLENGYLYYTVGGTIKYVSVEDI